MQAIEPAKSTSMLGEPPSVKTVINLLSLGILLVAVWTKAGSTHSMMDGFGLEDCEYHKMSRKMLRELLIACRRIDHFSCKSQDYSSG